MHPVSTTAPRLGGHIRENGQRSHARNPAFCRESTLEEPLVCAQHPRFAHVVHHINSRIPFYRLPEAMEKIPEFQTAHTTTLNPADIFRCLRLKVWDAEAT